MKQFRLHTYIYTYCSYIRENALVCIHYTLCDTLLLDISAHCFYLLTRRRKIRKKISEESTQASINKFNLDIIMSEVRKREKRMVRRSEREKLSDSFTFTFFLFCSLTTYTMYYVVIFRLWDVSQSYVLSYTRPLCSLTSLSLSFVMCWMHKIETRTQLAIDYFKEVCFLLFVYYLFIRVVCNCTFLNTYARFFSVYVSRRPR